jgi:predicted ribosomally synthesized peptide with nif11-like leader
MQELYAKVASDATLQAKFNQIMKEAEEASRVAIEDKLVDFAKGAGFAVSLEEMQAFFSELAEKQEDQLSDAQLDQVAGGKSGYGTVMVVGSVLTLGISCLAQSIVSQLAYENQFEKDPCGKMFE